MMLRAAVSAISTPQLIVVVDTEEEFDWRCAVYSRTSTDIGHLRRIADLQSLFEAHGVHPVYAVDYPIVSQSLGIEALGPLVTSGRASVAAHLHPWVSPPFVEDLCSRNTYPGNLPRQQEAEKLRQLLHRIEAGLGTPAQIYRAGRHGIGVNTFAILDEVGIEVDLSPSPAFDYSADGGPDFSTCPAVPMWVGPHGRILSIPSTGAFVGHVPNPSLYRWLTCPQRRQWRLPALAARLRLIERMRLSPEGQSLEEMCRLTRWLHRRGTRLFVLSLHSPSIEPGHTPFVRDAAERDDLLRRLDGYFTFFCRELGGAPTDPLSTRRVMGNAGPRSLAA